MFNVKILIKGYDVEIVTFFAQMPRIGEKVCMDGKLRKVVEVIHYAHLYQPLIVLSRNSYKGYQKGDSKCGRK